MNHINTLKHIGTLCIFLIITNLHAKQHTIQINEALDLESYKLIPLTTKIDHSKIIVLDFWATWCGPCIAAFPELEKIQKEFENDIQILSVSNESQKKAADFIDKKKYQLSFFVDPSQKLFTKFDINSLPITAILAKNNTLIWAGPSEDLWQTLNNYLSGKSITQNSEDTTYSKYYTPSTPKTSTPNTSFEYYVRIGKSSDPYTVRSQKNKKDAAHISYQGVTATELLMDLLQIESGLRLTNHRKDLNKTIINMVAKSNTNHITYGMAINFVLNDLKDQLDFQISQIQKETEVFELKVTDDKKLSPYINNIPGGGYARTKNGQLTITRLSLNNLANLLENKLKHIVTENNASNEKFNLILNTFTGIEDLNWQLEKYGLKLHAIQKDITHTIIK